MNNRILGLVPARSGSKRLKGKNTLDICGKPLIAWSIEAASNSNYIDTVITSSDSSAILKIAEDFGSKTLLRSQNFSNDDSSTVSVVQNVIDSYAKDNFDYIMLLQPTSPLRSSDDINKAVELLNEKKADAIISVCESSHPPSWMNKLPSSLSMNGFIKDKDKNKRSQDLGNYYMVNGAIYLFNVARFKQEKTMFFNKNTFAYIMDIEKSIDIDTSLDFDIATLLLKKKIHFNSRKLDVDDRAECDNDDTVN